MVVEDRLMEDHGAFIRWENEGFNILDFICALLRNWMRIESLCWHHQGTYQPLLRRALPKVSFREWRPCQPCKKLCPGVPERDHHLSSSMFSETVHRCCCVFARGKSCGAFCEAFQPPLKLDWSQVQIGIARDHQIDLERKKRMVALQVPNWADYTAAAVVIPCAFLWRDFLKLRIVTTSLQQIGGEDIRVLILHFWVSIQPSLSQEELGDRIQQEVKPGVDEIIKLGSSMEVMWGNFCGRYLLGAC